jgi:hypothetical protein
MTSNKMQLIACRTYSLLFGAFGVCFMLGGLVLLYWSAYGAPPKLEHELVKAHLKLVELAMLGWVLIVFGGAHAALSIFAISGRIWPLVAGTVCWVLLFAPSLWVPGSHVMSIATLGTSVTLTVLAVIAPYILRASAPSQTTAAA